MKPSAFICSALLLLVAGCGGESHQDLRAWMQEQGKGVKGKLDPLPQVKPYEPFVYNAFDLPDPFKPRKIEPVKGGSKLAPDLNRRKEPLGIISAGIVANGRDAAKRQEHLCLGAYD